ncbi:MAG: molybdenum cofactor biosynthesis protein MoaE [Acidimicrobiia bacterium]|nr:molybdenum cofactor biosynthesis protein MoaE [bacterium]MXW68558.1 molybdenum cofactor biosynthesis protein MoaE [Acidimicrobiia bacterium]
MNDPFPCCRVAVVEDDIDVGALLEEVGHPEAGAVALFLGTVRNHSPRREGVTHLEYEVYRSRVCGNINEIVSEAAQRWSVIAMAVEHRMGRVEVGQVAVAVAVSSAHRAEAFAAARYLIDELKERAPIWKKEHWEGGAEWSLGS